MSAFSDYLEREIVDFWLRGINKTPPTTVYLALFQSDPTEEIGGGIETAYSGYARQAVTWTAIDEATGQTKNSTVITFPANGNAAQSVNITHAAVFDQLTGGNKLLYGPLASSKSLAPGDVLSFAPDALALTID